MHVQGLYRRVHNFAPTDLELKFRTSGNKLVVLLALFVVGFVVIQDKVTKLYPWLSIQQHLWELGSPKHKRRNVRKVSKLLVRCKNV